jgi:hypothetical protein
MLIVQVKWKEISYKEYQKLTKGKNTLGIMLSDVKKELNFKKLIGEYSGGIMEQIRKINELQSKEHNIEDYLYYKRDGYETIFMGGEKAIKEFEECVKSLWV